MTRLPMSAAERWFFRLSVLLAAVSGLGQMPIFSRYYVADIPGLGWTGNFLATHVLHYVGVAGFLWVVGLWTGRRLGVWRHWRLTGWGRVVAACLAGLVASGVMAALQNVEGIDPSPWAVRLADWSHIAMAMLLGMASLAAKLGRKSLVRPVPPT